MYTCAEFYQTNLLSTVGVERVVVLLFTSILQRTGEKRRQLWPSGCRLPQEPERSPVLTIINVLVAGEGPVVLKLWLTALYIEHCWWIDAVIPLCNCENFICSSVEILCLHIFQTLFDLTCFPLRIDLWNGHTVTHWKTLHAQNIIVIWATYFDTETHFTAWGKLNLISIIAKQFQYFFPVVNVQGPWWQVPSVLLAWWVTFYVIGKRAWG